MSVLQESILLLLTAAVLNNALFTRGLGAGRRALTLSNPRETLFLGLAITLISVLTCFPAWPLVQLAREYELASRLGLRYVTSLATLLCLCVVYLLTYLLSRAYLPKFHFHFRKLSTRAAFNSILLGSLVIAFSNRYGFFQTLGFVAGSGLGYTASLLLLGEGYRRVMLSDLPRAFRGIPVMLLYAGLFSLALYGLIGHPLAT